MEKSHKYTLDLEWTGAGVDGTFTYEGYSREHTIRIAGKPDIISTADPAFRGDPSKHNPEDLLQPPWPVAICSPTSPSPQKKA